MLTTLISKSMAHQLDKWILYAMNRRVPDSFTESYRQTPSFETVLAGTSIDLGKTPRYQLYAPGEHPIWLNTMNGRLLCHVRVQLAVDPEAPLILYHHGFNELPYTASWRRIFAQPLPVPAHTVCVQAPFHATWLDPFRKGFASLQSVYQIFAGSLRIMELLQSHFERQGAAFTMASGISWGGITSLLYQGIFQRTRAVAPMLASPDLAQVIWDIATLLGRPIPISRNLLKELLDFTPYFRRCDPERVFPLMGENDLFFRLEHHSGVFEEQAMVTIPEGHVTGSWKAGRLRQHVAGALNAANALPVQAKKSPSRP